MTTQRFELQFKEMLPSIVQQRAHFFEAFGGNLEITDGVSENTNAFMLKKNVDPVAIGNYSTDANNVFGTNATAPQNRFGQMKEIKYTNVEVPYEYDWAVREGLDRHTVNANLDEAVADRLSKIGLAYSAKLSTELGKKLEVNKQEELTASDATEASLIKLFGDAYAKFENAEVFGTKRAYVTPELYTKLVDLNLTTTAKNAGVNIDDNKLVAFKGFILNVVPTKYMPSEVDVIFVVDNVGISFVGIETARTIESQDFDGIELQEAQKGGSYIPEENKIGIYTGKITGLPAV